MPLFICEYCQAIDNTALGGSFWQSRIEDVPVLCSECNPEGRTGGKWHEQFDKYIAADADAERYAGEMIAFEDEERVWSDAVAMIYQPNNDANTAKSIDRRRT